jgi:hypothetical protein
VSEHQGLVGGIDRNQPDMVAPYFATYSTEVIFHVNTLLPNEGEQKKSLITKDYVLVLWMEDDVSDIKTIGEPPVFKSSPVHIIIHPQAVSVVLLSSSIDHSTERLV